MKGKKIYKEIGRYSGQLQSELVSSNLYQQKYKKHNFTSIIIYLLNNRLPPNYSLIFQSQFFLITDITRDLITAVITLRPKRAVPSLIKPRADEIMSRDNLRTPLRVVSNYWMPFNDVLHREHALDDVFYTSCTQNREITDCCMTYFNFCCLDVFIIEMWCCILH